MTTKLAWRTVPQAVTLTGPSTVAIHPRWLIPIEAGRSVSHVPNVEVYGSFMEWAAVYRPARVCFLRSIALGDVLMLMPVCRALRRLLGLRDPVLIACHHKIQEQLVASSRLDPDVRLVAKRGIVGTNYGADVHMCLDRCLELDHLGGDESNHHRVALYALALGLEIADAQL